jgi:hypothetical protein
MVDADGVVVGAVSLTSLAEYLTGQPDSRQAGASR